MSPSAGRLPGHRRGRRRDPARQPQQVRVRRGGRRLPPRSRPRVGGPLQLRLRLHHGHAGGRRRPHRRPAPDRRADVSGLPRLGAPDRRPRDARRQGRGLQGPVRGRRAIPHQAHVEDLDQVRPHRLVEIEHFFNTYKLLEEKDDRRRRLARRGPGPRGARSPTGRRGRRNEARPAQAGRDGHALNDDPRLFVAVPLSVTRTARRRGGRRAHPGRRARRAAGFAGFGSTASI